MREAPLVVPWLCDLHRKRSEASETWGTEKTQHQVAATSKKALSGGYRGISSKCQAVAPGRSLGIAKVYTGVEGVPNKMWMQNTEPRTTTASPGMERIAAEINIPVNTAHSSCFLPTPLRLLNNNESVINLHRRSPPVGDLWSQEQPKGTRRGSKDNLLKMFMEKHQPCLHIPWLNDEYLKQQHQLCETFQITKDWENACNTQRM